MPRRARIIPQEGALHVTVRGNNKMRVFKRDRDYRYLMALLHRYKQLCSCLIYHYVLMKNHVHLVVGVTPVSDISKMMHGLCLNYAGFYKRGRPHIGHFWQDRFKSIVIDSDEYLLRCGLYVERNPVAAGLVGRPEDYRWSSYRRYAFGEKDPIVTENPLYRALGDNAEERMEQYRALMEATMADTAAESPKPVKCANATPYIIKC